MRLYTRWQNSAGERVRIALNLKGLAYEYVAVGSLPPGGYQRLNPQGLMPALRVGDRMEIEVSQFLQAPTRGRANYYGTAVLYVVGQGGLVPWEGRGATLDSFPLPEDAWMGGRHLTLPYAYSNEPSQRFNQIAGHLAPHSAQPMASLLRLEGSVPRAACRAHIAFSSGTKTKIMKGLKDWYQVDGMVKPRIVGQAVCWSAHSCSVLPCCS